MITVLVGHFVRNDEFRRVKGTNVKYLKRDEIYLKITIILIHLKKCFKMSFSYLYSLEEVQYSRVRFQVAGEMPPSFTFPDGTGL